MIQTTGAVNSSYTYNSRGNMLSKTVNGETTTFEYGNTLWQDQLTKVNGKALTYDANGNLKSYDGSKYTWSHGKRLSSITNGDTTYKYQYDLNGIRSYKTVNGVTTKFDTLNGKILAQSDSKNKIFFQYDGDTPVGFELNETQYFYLTNLSGDVVGITDADGNLIAEYSYDEWGKLLNIETAEEDNEEQQEIAELNPLRYRGYYYDNETGMYYLQSRYYNPELCRFISVDNFSFVNNRKELNVNAYAYCVNNPINYIDPFGYIAAADDAAWMLFIYEMLKIFAEGLAVAVASAAFIIVILKVIVDAFSGIDVKIKEKTKTFSDVKAKSQSGQHYKIAYVNNRNELVKIGKN